MIKNKKGQEVISFFCHSAGTTADVGKENQSRTRTPASPLSSKRHKSPSTLSRDVRRMEAYKAKRNLDFPEVARSENETDEEVVREQTNSYTQTFVNESFDIEIQTEDQHCDVKDKEIQEKPEVMDSCVQTEEQVVDAPSPAPEPLPLLLRRQAVRALDNMAPWFCYADSECLAAVTGDYWKVISQEREKYDIENPYEDCKELIRTLHRKYNIPKPDF